MKTLAIAGTFDTKGKELSYIKQLAEKRGLNTLCIHTGVFEAALKVDISNQEIVKEAGRDLAEIVAERDRAVATELLAQGMELLLPRLYNEEKFDAILSIGGSGGTSIVTPGMRQLPIGVPKLMVSTMASGNVAQYVGISDIIMMPSITDVEGLNSISRRIFSSAVNAIAGMLNYDEVIEPDEKPLLAATMFGVTTPCIKTAKAYLESKGYEVLVFHATGAGGKSMESLIEAGFIKGVLDITTTEWCDEVVGGVLNAGPHRLEAAGRKGIPQVVSVGALDMVNFGSYDAVPVQFKNRLLYKHNPTVTLMRTTKGELSEIGSIIAEKLNTAMGLTVLMLPLKGVSGIDVEGQPFYDPEADNVLFDTLRGHINDTVDIIELEYAINDDAFAVAAAQKLIDLLEEAKR